MLTDKMRMLYYRQKKPTTIEQALRQLVSPRLVDKLAQRVPTHHLVEAVAKELSLDRQALLRQVSARLHLGFSTQLSVPTHYLLSSLGYEPDLLKALYALPQQPHGFHADYSIVISNPQIVDIAQFRARGVETSLALGSDIEEVWQKFDWASKQFGKDVSVAQMYAVVKQLALDAEQLDAHEVFIGHPAEDHYEFLAGNKRFSGKLHPGLYPLLLSQFQETYRITREIVDSPSLKSVSVSLTRSFERPVICLTWQLKKGAEEEFDESMTAIEEDEKSLAVRSDKEGQAAARTADKIPSEKPQAAGRHVLLVDDDERLLLILSRIMENKGWIVTKEKNGKEALDAIVEKRVGPDLIISDVHMPHMDGAAFLTTLRQSGIDTPVLMLTSDDDGLLEAELVLLGADAFVRKQEDPRILLAWCNNLVARALRMNNGKEVEERDNNAYQETAGDEREERKVSGLE